MKDTNILEMYLETEEIITPQEYIARREKGEINPRTVEIVPPSFGKVNTFGAFKVKLKTPRYKQPDWDASYA